MLRCAITSYRWRSAAPPHLDGAPISGDGAMRSESTKSKSRRTRRKNPRDATASLPDDIVFKILSRLPVKSLCRCKAVSPRWRSLIFHEDYSRKFPQTLPCLLYSTTERRPKRVWHCTNVWEGHTHRRPLVAPSLSFLPAGYTILDCCNGMLLCRFSESNSHDAFRYVVCNPLETTVVVLPNSGCGANKRLAFLAFDRAFYPEFHVFEFVMDAEIDPYYHPNVDMESVVGANIYSSVTGAWNYKESGWSPEVRVYTGRCSFFNGFLHFRACSGATGVLAVDVKGEKWWSIPYPSGGTVSQFVGIYKEHLCYISLGINYVLSFWILEDYTKYDWTMKHQVSRELLCEKQLNDCKGDDTCTVVGILPDCNFILYVTGSGTLMAYDIDHEEIHAIQNLKKHCHLPYFLYVPFYTE